MVAQFLSIMESMLYFQERVLYKLMVEPRDTPVAAQKGGGRAGTSGRLAKEVTMGEWMRAIGYAGTAAVVIQLANPDPDALGSMAQDFTIMLPVMRAAVMAEGQMCGACGWLRGWWR